jgi:glycosyltransferase involved in cell wall biosynthesis
MRIAHIISGLDTGGAELFLERLIRCLPAQEFEHTVISLTSLGRTGERLRSSGVQVHALQSGWHPLGIAKLAALNSIMKKVHPGLIQGWMYHGNLAAYIAARMSGRRYPMLWNIRHSLDQWTHEKIGLRAVVRLGGRLSTAPQRIIFNASSAAQQHERLGYPQSKACIIPNGFDLQVFSPIKPLRISMRKQLALRSDDVLVGMIARFHPLKDHENFLRAARIVADSNHDARFVLVGKGITSQNGTLMDLVRELRLEKRLMLLGERDDIAHILNALDICVSSSSSEAFPNAVGEAMSCQVPCVVTDVGASGELIADTGILVPPRSHELLASGILQLQRAGAEQRRQRGIAARERIRGHYSNNEIARQYADLYRCYMQI